MDMGRKDEIERFGVYWVDLDPTRGSEIKKTRPCIVISPDELNRHLNTVIVVPLTSTLRYYPFRVRCLIADKEGEAAIDQLKTVDKSRIGKRMSVLSSSEIRQIKEVLHQMFE